MPIILLFFSLILHAHIIKDDVSVTEKSRFNLKTVCSKLVTHESPLIEVVSGSEIDCMGSKVLVSKFCEKELAADPYYLRAYVDRESKEVVCVSGKKVIFQYLCVKLSDKKFCAGDAKVSCEIIHQKLAYRLDMIHYSFTKNEKGIKQLNCYFESLPLKDKK